jgi:hypothetical protein
MPGHNGPQFPPGGRYAKLANEFGTNPPADGIPVVRAQRELRLTNDTIVALIRSGKVRAGVGKQQNGGRVGWALLVSKTDCAKAAPYPPGGRTARLVQEFSTNPPRDGIPIEKAKKDYGLAYETIISLVRVGQLRAGVGRYGKSWSLLVSKKTCAALKTPKQSDLPTDALPVKELAIMHGLADYTIRKWMRWESHPALGRKINHGIGAFIATDKMGRQRRHIGLMLSAADVKACAESAARSVKPAPRGQPPKVASSGPESPPTAKAKGKKKK